MVQSLNTKALVTLASVIRRPSLVVPHVSVDNISQVNYAALKEQAGIRAIIFDKDNTLTAPYAMEIHPLAASGLETAKQVFGTDNVAIMSNSAGTLDDHDYHDAQQIETALGIAVIRHDEKKPGGLNEVLSHFRLDDPAALCMVGDRLLTDVVFGNLYGMLTIHTLPLCRGADNQADNTPAKIIRSVENMGLYGNWFGGRMLQRNKPHHKYWPGEVTWPLVTTPSSPSENSNNHDVTKQG
jgi:phosphatidylglycerophosphatase GEP4